MQAATADVVIIGPAPRRERIAVVEVNNVIGLSPEHRSNHQGFMRVTGGLAQYYLLVSQDIGFLWTQSEAVPVGFDMRAVIRRFMPDLAANSRLLGMTVESLVSHWLSILALGLRSDEEEPERTLASTGFLAAIRGADVLSKTTA